MNRAQREALKAKTEAIRAEKAQKPTVAERVIERLTDFTEQLEAAVTEPAPIPPPKKEKKPFRPWTPRQNDRAIQAKGRLPDGARFTAVYDAANMLWHGMLEIPEAPTVSGRSSGIFQLLHELDDQWRAHLKAQEGQK